MKIATSADVKIGDVIFHMVNGEKIYWKVVGKQEHSELFTVMKIRGDCGFYKEGFMASTGLKSGAGYSTWYFSYIKKYARELE